MRNFVPVIFILIVFSNAAVAESAVWKVHHGNQTIYIGGTVHLLRPSDFPLPEEFEQAYNASDRLIFETDIAALNTPAVQSRIITLMMAEPGKSLDRLLTPQTLAKLSDAAAKRGLDINQIKQFKAGMVVTTLQITEMMRLGMTLEGVDSYFSQRAARDHRPTGQLETIDAQIAYLANMGKGNEDEFIRRSLDELDNIETLYQQIIASWKEGNLQQLDALVVRDMRTVFPEVYRQLLVKRNNDWLPNIEALFDEPGTEYVLVGAAHLVGEDGLLQQLQKKGYKTTQIKAAKH